MSLNDFAWSKGLGSYELSIGVLNKRTQKAEVFVVRTQEQWDIWATLLRNSASFIYLYWTGFIRIWGILAEKSQRK